VCTSDIPEPILFPCTKIQNINQNRHPKRLEWTSSNHVQDPQLLVSVDAKISGDNTSIQNTTAYTSHGNINPASLITSGTYSTGNRLRNHIMFPVEKPSMLNTIGQRIPERSISMMNLLHELLDKIAESTGTHLWKGFITFGSASAGVLAVFIIVLIKLIIHTIIHGYALHSIYRCGIHFLTVI